MKKVIEQCGVLFEPELFGNIVVGFTDDLKHETIFYLVLKHCEVYHNSEYVSSDIVILREDQYHSWWIWNHDKLKEKDIDFLTELYFKTRKGRRYCE